MKIFAEYSASRVDTLGAFLYKELSRRNGVTDMAEPLSDTIDTHVSKDNVSVILTRFGRKYYVERVGPLGHKLSDTPYDSLVEARKWFNKWKEYHK